MLRMRAKKEFANGHVYLLHTKDGLPIETTDTWLPYYTKDAVGQNQNFLLDQNLGSRSERWMIGVSTMSGCPVGCKFCATGKLKKCRRLNYLEMVNQVIFVVNRAGMVPGVSQEFKINWTRMGEPFMNIVEVRRAMETLSAMYPNVHHYVSTIGIKGADYSWIEGNTTLQVSLHSFDEVYRDWLIPFPKKASIVELGQIRTRSNLKTTVNLSLARLIDFNVNELKKHFDKEHFFIKISPINENTVSKRNNIGCGIIKQQNIL